MFEMAFIQIGCFQPFSIPKKLLVVYKSIKKVEFDCEMKMHCKIYSEEALFSTEIELDKIFLESCF